MNTLLLHIPLNDPNKPFHIRVAELCDVQLAAGYKVASTFIFGQDLFILFQIV
jgi:hypothetical protein